MPTAIASTSPRRRWASSRLASPEIHCESPVAWRSTVERERPFRVTSGRPVRACFRNGWLSVRAASALGSVDPDDGDPGLARALRVRGRLAFSVGSSEAMTTRPMPASTIAAAQGGCLPSCAQGSSVTYISAPRGSRPRASASAIAAVSA